MTLNASTKLSKPSFFSPSASYFDRYRPARISFSRVEMSALEECPRTINHLLQGRSIKRDLGMGRRPKLGLLLARPGLSPAGCRLDGTRGVDDLLYMYRVS